MYFTPVKDWLKWFTPVVSTWEVILISQSSQAIIATYYWSCVERSSAKGAPTHRSVIMNAIAQHGFVPATHEMCIVLGKPNQTVAQRQICQGANQQKPEF